ncbi:MAG: hypothetical protein M3540_01380, partial [Actinomycetota bacterium]|nr:hypothetical protein [Actinomycetota bacterium]
AEPGGRLCEGVVDGVAVADVAGEALHRACERLRGLLEPPTAAREQRQRRAFRRKPLRDRAADPRAGPGDDGVPSGEAAGLYGSTSLGSRADPPSDKLSIRRQ